MRVYQPSKYSGVTVVEINKNEIEKIDFALCKQPKETLKSYYDRQQTKPDFLINGGIFNMSDGATYYNYRDEGVDISGWHWFVKGMGIVNGELKYGEISSEKWKDFVTAYPPLIENKTALPITYATENNYKKRRSVLAYDDVNIYLIAVEGAGMKFEAVQNMLLDMGITYAINLDGGGSTKILQDGKSLTSASYNRAVDNVIAFYLKKKPVNNSTNNETPKVIYRVQAGAFSNKIYAIAFRDKIRNLGTDYADAYVRLIDGKYKVQIGAFSKIENARRFAEGLKAKDIDCFITSK